MDEDKVLPGDDPVLKLARKRFEQAMEAEDENRGKQADDMKFLAATPDDNFQWPAEILRNRQAPGQEGGIRPCLTINKMRSHQRQVTNEQRMNRPQIIARPGDSKASAEVAKALNGWLRHIQVASEADLAFDTACDWQTGAGEGYFRLYTEYADPMSFDQDVVFAPCPDRFKVYLDPIGLKQHPAGRKCRWGFIIEDIPREEYEEQYKGEDEAIDWTLAGVGDQQQWFPSKEQVRIAEYFELVDRKKTICLWKGPDGNPAVSEQGSEEDARYRMPGSGYEKVQERKTTVHRCIWRKMTGQKVLSEKEMPTQYIPIVRVVGNQWVVDGKVIVDGMVRPSKDAQRMYNYNASAEIEINALQPKTPIMAMVEQIKGHEDKYRQANTAPLAYLPYNAVRNDDDTIVAVAPPARMAAPMPPAAFIQAKIGADNDIKATMGQWGPSLGEPSSEKSGKAINARKMESDVGTFHYIDNLARALRYAGTIAVDMAAEIITSRRILRILGEDGEPDHVTVDPEMDVPYKEELGPDGKKVKVYNFAMGKYEVVVNTGPSFTTRRAEAADFLTSAVQAAKDPATANVLTYLALKNQDWAGADEAVTLLKTLLPPPALQAMQGDGEEGAQMSPQAQSAIDQLKGMAGQLKGQLDAAQQALTQRDQQLSAMKTEAAGKVREGMVKMYEADKKAMAEIEKARADVLVAEAETARAMMAQPENEELKRIAHALGHTKGELEAKLNALADATAEIAAQLNNFEIAARMPHGAIA